MFKARIYLDTEQTILETEVVPTLHPSRRVGTIALRIRLKSGVHVPFLVRRK